MGYEQLLLLALLVAAVISSVLRRLSRDEPRAAAATPALEPPLDRRTWPRSAEPVARRSAPAAEQVTSTLAPRAVHAARPGPARPGRAAPAAPSRRIDLGASDLRAVVRLMVILGPPRATSLAPIGDPSSADDALAHDAPAHDAAAQRGEPSGTRRRQ